MFTRELRFRQGPFSGDTRSSSSSSSAIELGRRSPFQLPAEGSSALSGHSLGVASLSFGTQELLPFSSWGVWGQSGTAAPHY